jgi:hypothetical protein
MFSIPGLLIDTVSYADIMWQPNTPAQRLGNDLEGDDRACFCV